MNDGVRITSVRFNQFKAFPHYSISLDRVNILVGPNNSGKSTVIGAFRALPNALRVARSKPPTRIELETGRKYGYRIPDDSLPISLENVHTDYDSTDSDATFRLSNGNKLQLLFPRDGGCVLIPDADGIDITNTGVFKRSFPLTLTAVPVLGPVEHREKIRERDTVVSGLSTHRAARHFRNYWRYFDEGFDEFSNLVSSTWPGMAIGRPEINRDGGELSMFCQENRMARELYWVGFGFQVWCQLLTHISRAKDSSIIIIDEPEVYLHPDVQRQLLGIVRDIGSDVLLATHSTEIMSEADPNEIILVDKRKQSGERLKDIAGVQRALNAVGSIQNITLTALARNRRLLFVEGTSDFALLRRFAKKLGMSELAAGLGVTPQESGGFGSHERVLTLADGIKGVLGAPMLVAAIYDRDFYCDEQIATITESLTAKLQMAHIHLKKEIENYLLIPNVLERALVREISERAVRSGGRPPKSPDVLELLDEVTESLKNETMSQIISRRIEYLKHSGKDAAHITKETLARFSAEWRDPERRLSLVPGKECLSLFREKVQKACGASLSDARIIDAIRKEEIPPEIVQLLEKLEVFRRTNV